MASHSQRPKKSDVVLGGQKSLYSHHAAVLGGLSGVKHRFNSHVASQRMGAVTEAVNYGQAGFSLVLKALQDDHWLVRYVAYLLLPKLEVANLKDLLVDHNPFQKFNCLYRYSTAPSTAYALAMSPDGQFLASGGSDRNIQVRSLTNGKVIRTLAGHWNSVSSLVFHPHKEVLVSGSWDGTVKVWRKEALIRNFIGHETKINVVTISPDGQLIGSASQDGKIKIWQINQLKAIYSWQAHENWVNSLIFTPDGKSLISCSSDCTIKVWDVQTKNLTYIITQSDWVKCLALSCDGKFLASGSQDKTISLFDFHTKELLHTLKGHWGEINSLAISQEGQTLVSGSWDETINIWHIPTGVCLHSLTGHQRPVFSLVLNRDLKRIVPTKIFSTSKDKTIRVWGGIDF
ncbi:MAG: WD40 repeat domain-containing protein [Spirulinaceae cyanobacterium]